MKKIIKLICLTTITSLFLVACGNKDLEKDENLAENQDKLDIVTTIFPAYDFTREIGKDRVDLTMLVKPGSEIHSFDPTPQDIKKIQNCDLFIYNGGESDVWVDNILASLDKEPKTIKMMDCVETMEEEIVEGMQVEEHDHEHEDEVEVEVDEHIWTSPKNAIKIAEKIGKELEDIDKENAKFYAENTIEFVTQLKELDTRLEDIISSAKRRTIVFGDRFPFAYLARDYGLDYFAAFNGCSTETDASPATVAFLVNKINDNQIPVVFNIEMSNEKISDSICDSTSAKKLMLHSCQNVSADEFKNGETYISIMDKNLENIREALN